MIEFKNVSKSYQTPKGLKYALRDVTFQIPTNANIGILGKNGAGKSTLLRLIGKIDFPTKGTIKTTKSVSWPVGLGNVYQGSMTARENTRFVGRINGVEDLKKLEDQVYEFSEIGNYFDMPVKTYSSGMKSRFTFALSMAFKFDVYLIDEVTSVGDRSFRSKCQKTLKERRKESSILMVSHNLDELINFCDVGLLLKDGKLQYFDRIKDAVKVYKETLC